MKPSTHHIFLMAIFGLFFCACSPKVVQPVQTTIFVHDTLKSKEIAYLRDSVFIEKESRNDTIFLTTYKEKIKYISKTDTIYKEKVKIKEVPIPVEVVRKEKQKTPFLVYALIFFLGGLTSIALLGRK